MSRVLRFLKWAAGFEHHIDKPRRNVVGALARHSCHRQLVCEALEDRRLLSVSLQVPHDLRSEPIAFYTVSPHAIGSTPQGLSPNQVRGAYGLGSYTAGVLSNGLNFSGIPGDGRGQTIAIVDAYDDPFAVEDLNIFSSYYGLPQVNTGNGPTFTKLNENGGTTLPGPDVPEGWGVEESLDIEWAHSIAPMANIILVEAASAFDSDLYTAVQTAANQPGVVAISMSWSGPEFSGETAYDSTVFATPVGHLGGAASIGGTNLPGGITFLAAAGDDGVYDPYTGLITPQYPDCSPNVISVGGTTLTVTGSDPNYTYGGETTWGNGTNSVDLGGGGGGISAFESQPAYQKGVVRNYSTTQRTYPDVSAEANNDPGVAVYDTYDFGGWVPAPVGGTSLSTPMWAAMISLADECRAIDGLGSLDGPSQTLPDLYSLPAADFHDITTGNANGPSPLYNPGPGYDLATGLGSPVGNLLIPALCPKGAGVTGITPNWGTLTGGTTVTITGYGLTGATAVNFGSSPATIISDTATQIVATSPPGSGTVDVTVVTPSGTSSTSPADQFHYVVTMSNVAELTASNGAAQNYFGRSVSISGNTMVVGAPFATVGKNAYQGAAYVFTGSGSTWTQTAEITASKGGANSYFGQSVSISGSTIVIGAIGNNAYAGAAYVYTGSGSTWTQTAKLVASDGATQSYFGSSVSISGATIVVGADGATVGTASGQGAAYVFTGSSSTWTQAAKLTASDGAAGDWFGSSVSISGNTVAVGAYYATINGNPKQGAAYVYAEPGSGWANMIQTAKLTASDGGANNFLGLSVAISGNTVVLGAYNGTTADGNLGQGAVYVFTQPSSGWTDMAQSTTLTASDGQAGDSFGDSVAISGNTIVVGAWGVTLGEGSAYVFTQANSIWTQTDQLTASGISADNNLGDSVAISGNTVLVGAPLVTVGQNAGQGAAFVYSLVPGSPAPAPGFSITGAASGSFAASQPISISWNAANVPKGSTISLAYDTTKIWGNPKWIELNGLPATNGSGAYSWNTAGLTAGTYYVEGYLYTASSGTKVLSQLTTSFTVTGAPATAAPTSTFTLAAAASGSYVTGQPISIKWNAATVPSGSKISLAYDTTKNWGDPKWIELNGVAAGNGSGSYSWNTAALAPGTYYIAGYLYTSSSGATVLSHLTTSFTVTASLHRAASPSTPIYAAALGSILSQPSSGDTKKNLSATSLTDLGLLAYLT
ncbi:MAG: IPT/TIG domain-containing protein [Thermoguttaceae bacterium]